MSSLMILPMLHAAVRSGKFCWTDVYASNSFLTAQLSFKALDFMNTVSLIRFWTEGQEMDMGGLKPLNN